MNKTRWRNLDVDDVMLNCDVIVLELACEPAGTSLYCLIIYLTIPAQSQKTQSLNTLSSHHLCHDKLKPIQSGFEGYVGAN